MSAERIDAYIARKAPFAQPILTYIRAVFHEAVPDLEEAIKWSSPHFVYKGKNLGGMAGFKAHAGLMIQGAGRVGEGMGGYGKIASIEDLPPKAEMIAEIRKAAADIDAGRKLEWSKQAPPKEAIAVPQDFAAALRESPAARATFEGFTDAQRRDYLVWITEAKREETRTKRIATTLEWLAEGKRMNWKYEAKKA